MKQTQSNARFSFLSATVSEGMAEAGIGYSVASYYGISTGKIMVLPLIVTAGVHNLGVIPRDLCEERRFRIRHEKTKALLEVAGLRPLLMCADPAA